MGHFLRGIYLLAGSFLGPHNPKRSQLLRITCHQKERRVKPCINGHQKKVVEGSDFVKSCFRIQTWLNSSVFYIERKLWDEMRWMAREKLMKDSRDGSCEETRLKKGKGTRRFGRMGWRNDMGKLVSGWERKDEKKLRGSERIKAFQWECGDVFLEPGILWCRLVYCLEWYICDHPGRSWSRLSYTFLLPFDLDREKDVIKA